MTFGSLKGKLRRMFLPTQLSRDLEALRLSQGRLLAELYRTKSANKLSDYEFQVFSQWGEDGIIQKLIRSIDIVHPTFIEFGVEDFTESNCRFLLMNDNWRGFVMDASAKNMESLRKADWFWKYDLNTLSAFVTREHINELLAQSGFDSDLGLLSIDIDGMDYWILEALTDFHPRILIAEYNPTFGQRRAITVPYDAAFSRRRAHYSDLYYGASLAALNHEASKKGYALVGVGSAGVNAFFVRSDLLRGDIVARSVEEVFVDCHLRQSRDTNGAPNYLSSSMRTAAIKGLAVVNVETGLTEAF